MGQRLGASSHPQPFSLLSQATLHDQKQPRGPQSVCAVSVAVCSPVAAGPASLGLSQGPPSTSVFEWQLQRSLRKAGPPAKKLRYSNLENLCREVNILGFNRPSVVVVRETWFGC